MRGYEEHLAAGEREPNTDREVDKKEIKEFTKAYSPLARDEQAHKIRIVRLRGELGIISDEEKENNIRGLQKGFDDRFEKQKQGFDIESEDVRSVEEISKKKGLIFVHTMPLDDFDNQMNTQMNNGVVSTKNLTIEERIGFLIHDKPSISSSTIKLGESPIYGKDNGNSAKSMYSLGVVFGSGTVFSAHRYDGGLNTLSNTARERKYDSREKDTSIQPNIVAQLEYATEGPFSYDNEKRFEEKHAVIDKGYGVGSNYNDISISNPEVSGFYLDEDFSTSDSPRRRDVINKIFKKYPDVPIYIKRNQMVKEYVWKDGALVAVEEPGKVGKNLPSKKLSDYEFPYADNAKFTNKLEEQRNYDKEVGSQYFSLNALGRVVNEMSLPVIIDARGWVYNQEIGRQLIKLLQSHPSKEFEVFEAIREDFNESVESVNSDQRRMREMAARQNDHQLIGKNSTFASLREDARKSKLIFNGIADVLAGGGYGDLAEKIRKLPENNL